MVILVWQDLPGISRREKTCGCISAWRISGALVYILSFNIFPAFTGIVADSVAIGASASVMLL